MIDNIPSDTWTRIVAGLNERLKTPSDTLPNVQWLSEYPLRILLLDVARATHVSPPPSGRTLLQMLVDSQLARKLPSDDFSDVSKSPAIYSLELGGTPSISPIELLQTTQASFQRSVICYFTALAYHELTTQETPHHHVATLKEPTKRSQPKSATSRTTDGKSEGNSSLGTLLFRYQGLPYYFTQRDPALMPGIQTVRYSASCLIRMTTLEQTLLDTLHKPWSCGGPSVVFEAWERGLPLVDDARLARCLTTIGRSDFTRRAGYMLEQFGHAAADGALCGLLSDAKAEVKADTVPTILLLPDVPATRLNPTWGVTA